MYTDYCPGHGQPGRRVCLDDGPDFGRCGDCGLLVEEFAWMRPERRRRRAWLRAAGFGLTVLASGLASWWVLH